ncbi:hypothetical protein Q3G72_022337 [Acer saccharum]|nr:hypothetical protein Q3G72_022337 [Acer saccharum]
MSPNTHTSLSSSSSPFPSQSSPPLTSHRLHFSLITKTCSTLSKFSLTPPSPTTPAESLFFSSLINSSFLTSDPERAHLFFVPFSSATSTRSLLRLVNAPRTDLPFWNRTLGADHFYVSCDGLGFNSDRNLVELKKNSIQISCFSTRRSSFVPHKDVTLPPLADPHHAPIINETKNYLSYVKYGAVKDKFCLFEYGDGDVSGISDAVRFGCVPVVITDRPIQDLPLMDVLRWQEIAVFVGWKNRSGSGAKRLRHVLDRTYGGEKLYEEVRGSCVTAGQHLVWNEEPQPLYAFHMMMYQLWLRRHTIRYARREVA